MRRTTHLFSIVFLGAAFFACGTDSAGAPAAGSGGGAGDNMETGAHAGSGAGGAAGNVAPGPEASTTASDDASVGAGGASGEATAGSGGARADANTALDGAGGAPPSREASADDAARPSGDAAAGPVFPPGVTRPKITIVGDSISAGPGCYKRYLLQNLTMNHYSKFEFVGEYADDCGGSVRHSAVSCSKASQWIQPTFTMPNCSQGKVFPGMPTVARDENPDLVMMQLGVNDIWGGDSTAAVLKNYATLIDQARAQNSRVVVVVAQIHKIEPNCSDTTTYAHAEALANAVPAWAKTVSTANSPVFTADLWTNSDFHQSIGDCIHPNDAGAQRMGLNWYNALKGILPPG